jgi:hypothetical protein
MSQRGFGLHAAVFLQQQRVALWSDFFVAGFNFSAAACFILQGTMCGRRMRFTFAQLIAQIALCTSVNVTFKQPRRCTSPQLNFATRRNAQHLPPMIHRCTSANASQLIVGAMIIISSRALLDVGGWL